MLQKLNNLFFYLRSFLPRRLPIGLKEFNSWLTDVLRLAKLPDNGTNRRIAANLIFQIRPNVDSVSIRSISKRLSKAASNQVAQSILDELKATTT